MDVSTPLARVYGSQELTLSTLSRSALVLQLWKACSKAAAVLGVVVEAILVGGRGAAGSAAAMGVADAGGGRGEGEEVGLLPSAEAGDGGAEGVSMLAMNGTAVGVAAASFPRGGASLAGAAAAPNAPRLFASRSAFLAAKLELDEVASVDLLSLRVETACIIPSTGGVDGILRAEGAGVEGEDEAGGAAEDVEDDDGPDRAA